MNSAVERAAPWFGAGVLGAAIATGALVSVGTGVLVIAGGLVVAILVVGYLAVDALLSEAGDLSTVADVTESEIGDLERQKAEIVTSLRDLQNERELGKISAADFEALDGSFRKRAVEVMKKIDRDLSSWRKRAEAMVAERVEQAKVAKVATVAKPEPAPEPRAVEPWPAPEARTCGSCAAPLDSDSTFCKKCGKRVACSSCSTPLDSDSLFCKKCGTKVEANA